MMGTRVIKSWKLKYGGRVGQSVSLEGNMRGYVTTDRNGASYFSVQFFATTKLYNQK